MNPPTGSRLAGYYGIGIIATTIGIFVVMLLNMFTPLEALRAQLLTLTGKIDGLTWDVMAGRLLPRFALVTAVGYGLIIAAVNRMLHPVGDYLQTVKRGDTPSTGLAEKARRRLLNLPFIFVQVSLGMWTVIPALLALSLYLAGRLDHRTAIILSARASMVGLIASAISSHEVEAYSRRWLIPYFFPHGRLAETTGAARISISKRIRLVNRLGSIVPMTILLVTLLTLQWEVDTTAMSAREYGRGIIIFTAILFAYTFIAAGNLNRVASRSITRPLQEMIRVLRRVRSGHFDERVRVVSNDEIGYTGDIINEMARGLQDRETIRRSLELAREVQQNLLPKDNPHIPGLDIAGTSIYCDETGGDYYDFIETGSHGSGDLRMVLGDVSGHGISAALLMATARAFLRQRSVMPGSLAQVVSDVNRQLSRDVVESGSFMTLFYLEVDLTTRSLRWVRAGHDPAIFYDPETDDFRELKGDGIALGLDETWLYAEKELIGVSAGQIAVLCTDGIWEAHNPQGEMFGKDTLCAVIRENAARSAQQISDAVIGRLKDFQAGAAPEDDVTLIVVKIGEGQ